MAQNAISTSILFIGAGPTTIGACYRLRDKNFDDYIVLEATDQFGGLSRSFVDSQGFTWDLGGHVQFSHYPEFDQAMDEACQEEGWLTHERESWVWIKNKFIPYPFQYNFQHLGKEVIDQCLQGLRQRQNGPIHNFKDWLTQEFGHGLCNLFMYPYNFKVWAHPQELMNHEWISERVATINMERIERNIQENKLDVSWGPNATFRFPKVGGTGQIWRNLGSKIIADRVKFNSPVVEINPKEKTVRTKDGVLYRYKQLFSTMPLDQLYQLVSDPYFKKERDQTQKLLHSSSHIIGFGIKGSPPASLRGKCWMYFPEANSPYYRVTLFSHYSPHNVPDINQHYSLMLEVSESPYKKVGSDIIEQCRKAIYEDQLIQPEHEIISSWYKRLEYGYPIPGLERNKIVKMSHDKLAPFQIYSRGRFGHWHYEVSNQDHSFMQGYEWVDWLLEGKQEKTLWQK